MMIMTMMIATTAYSSALCDAMPLRGVAVRAAVGAGLPAYKYVSADDGQ